MFGSRKQSPKSPSHIQIPNAENILIPISNVHLNGGNEIVDGQTGSVAQSPVSKAPLSFLNMSFNLPRRERRPSSPIEMIHDNVVFQMSRNDESIRDILSASEKMRSDLEITSKSMEIFSQKLGEFSSVMTQQMLEASLMTGDDQQETDQMMVNEKQKHRMLMASMHQIAKFYKLMSQEFHNMTTYMLDEFEQPMSEKQTEHRSLSKKWTVDYNADNLSLDHCIEGLKKIMSDPKVVSEHRSEIAKEIGAKKQELVDTKKRNLSQMIRAERHHYVNFAHRLQNALQQHLLSCRHLYQQNIDDVQDFADMTAVKVLLSNGSKPTDLLLKLRRPSTTSTGGEQGK